MTAKPPPIPDDQVSHKGPGDAPEVSSEDSKPARNDRPEQKGQQGNTWQNTHNQGYQQDR
jgi:hypothetical protein